MNAHSTARYLKIPAGSHMICFRDRGDRGEVMRVLHQRQDVDWALAGEAQDGGRQGGQFAHHGREGVGGRRVRDFTHHGPSELAMVRASTHPTLAG